MPIIKDVDAVVGGANTRERLSRRRADPLMQSAAREAIGEHVRIHTFGLGAAADAEPPHAPSHIAGATGGTFQRIHEPTGLHCQLLEALRR